MEDYKGPSWFGESLYKLPIFYEAWKNLAGTTKMFWVIVQQGLLMI